MKKFFAIFLAVLMIMTLAVPAFAEDTTADETTETPTYPDNSITINKASVGATYSIYKMLDLKSYNAETNAYYYDINSAWTNFFAEGNPGASYIVKDSTYGYVKLANGVTDVADLAKAAIKWAEDNSISATGDPITATSATVVFTGLELGYYLVDSSLGALCNLTTTDPYAVIEEKNGAYPTITKQVQEDSNSEWGATNDADMYQTVNFKITVNVDEGGTNYVIHDAMVDGWTLTDNPIISVTANNVTLTVGDAGYTYRSTTCNKDGCDFEIVIADSVISGMKDGQAIVIEYFASLNASASVGSTGNQNTAWLTFGDTGNKGPVTTTTYTYAFDLVKTDANSKVLDGAQFKLYDASTGGNEIAVVQFVSGVDGVYRIANIGETGVAIIPVDGKATIVGVDGKTSYYLEETVAPTGYNKLTSREVVTIINANLTAIIEQDIYSSGGVQIVNQTGTVLPETGGAGTTLFIVLGGLAVLTAGVLLFVKKRMEQVAE